MPLILKPNTARIDFPEFLFFLTIFVLPFEELITFGGFSIIKWVGLLFFAVSLTRGSKFYGVFPIEFVLFSVYIGIGVVQDLFKFNLNFASFNENIRPLLFLIMMVAVYNMSKDGRIRTIIMCLVASASLLALIQVFSLFPVVQNIYEYQGYEDRVSALKTDPNFTACFIAIGVVVNLMLVIGIVRSTLWIRAVCFIALLMGSIGIIQSASRGGLFALLVGLVAIAFVTKAGFKKQVIMLIVLLITVGLLGFAVSRSELYMYRLVSFSETGEVSGRDKIWSVAWVYIKKAPLFGYGYRMYLYELGTALGTFVKGTHNTFIASVMASGFIGASFFFAFIIRAAWSVWPTRKTFPGNIMFPCFMICLGTGMSVNAEIAKWFWIVLSMSIAVKRIKADQQRFAGSMYNGTYLSPNCDEGSLSREKPLTNVC